MSKEPIATIIAIRKNRVAEQEKLIADLDQELATAYQHLAQLKRDLVDAEAQQEEDR